MASSSGELVGIMVVRFPRLESGDVTETIYSAVKCQECYVPMSPSVKRAFVSLLSRIRPIERFAVGHAEQEASGRWMLRV